MNHLAPRSDEVLAVAHEHYARGLPQHWLTVDAFREAVRDGRLCECGCGQPPSPASKFANRDRCRQRAYHNRVTAAARDQGVSARPNLTDLTRRTHARSADAPAPARKPRKRTTDLRVSYRKVVDAMTELVLSVAAAQQLTQADARERAESHAAALLTDKQLTALNMSNPKGDPTHA